MKKIYISPMAELYVFMPCEGQMLDTSNVPVGGGGYFDTRGYDWNDGDWSDDE